MKFDYKPSIARALSMGVSVRSTRGLSTTLPSSFLFLATGSRVTYVWSLAVPVVGTHQKTDGVHILLFKATIFLLLGEVARKQIPHLILLYTISKNKASQTFCG